MLAIGRHREASPAKADNTDGLQGSLRLGVQASSVVGLLGTICTVLAFVDRCGCQSLFEKKHHRSSELST